MKDFLEKKLAERNLPELRTKEEMLSVLLEQEYGFLPPKPERLSFETEDNIINRFCAGKAVLKKITADCVIEGKRFSFPFFATVPTKPGKYPFFIHINFRPDVPDRYMPTEELIDNGFAVLSFCYEDVTSDDGDFTDGLAGVLFEKGERKSNDSGKISMWAWAAQRVMDYACLHADIYDLDRSVVCGHSRLGKTALLTAATDERFRFAYSNEAGCSGDALARGTTGETVGQIIDRFPFWFCENYAKYYDKEENMPFDQHYLLSCIAPRFVCVGSAAEDAWADPRSQYLCCAAASPAFENGLSCPDRFPEPGEKFLEGDIGFHLRNGIHYFSREDWHRLIEFVNIHS